MTKNFAVIGVAGYVAPRHLRAIKDTGNRIVAAVDPSPNVGILDRYSLDIDFFTELERFRRHALHLTEEDESRRINYVSVCSPNHCHDIHSLLGLEIGADVICEKPLVINPRNLDTLVKFEERYGRRVYSVLQLRHHPSLLELKRRIESDAREKHDVDLTYVTPRGKWPDWTWKGKDDESGGLAMNLGIHLFDVLTWIFGDARSYKVHYAQKRKVSGELELDRARVKWSLSADAADLPEHVIKKEEENPPYRSIKVNGEEIEFSDGFGELHTKVYQEILAGRGSGIEDVRESIKLAYEISNEARRLR